MWCRWLTALTESLIRPVRTLLHPVTSQRDVNATAIVTKEVVVWADTRASCLWTSLKSQECFHRVRANRDFVRWMALGKERQVMRGHLTGCAAAAGSGKVGGFLLDLPDWTLRNHRGFSSQGPCPSQQCWRGGSRGAAAAVLPTQLWVSSFRWLILHSFLHPAHPQQAPNTGSSSAQHLAGWPYFIRDTSFFFFF